MKEFNVEAVCVPSMHYMVDITGKLKQIQELIRKGKYFTINRSRQYGKTTTLAALFRKLKDDYIILRLSFEGAGSGAFQSDENFVMYFIRSITKALKYTDQPVEIIEQWKSKDDYRQNEYEDAFEYLSDKITWLCSNREKEILLFIDEADKTSDNQIFLNFLGMLRNKYIKRQEGMDDTFKSVILAGVYDIKNLKLKLRPEEERKYNSPWNTRVDNEENGCLQTFDDCPRNHMTLSYDSSDFNVDMSFHPEEIATMLEEYEADHHTGMDIRAVSEELYHYTNGYPYLVSWLCKWIDEKGDQDWTNEGIRRAGKELLMGRTPLFDDMIKNVEHYSGLREIIEQVLYSGSDVPFNLSNGSISLGHMFGILARIDGKTRVSNILFETYLYDYFSLLQIQKGWGNRSEKSQFLREDGHLDMVHVLDRFQALMKAEYRREDEKFLESQGRLLFLCFLKPIINGTGFYYVEPETRSSSRMDIVVTYPEEEFVIELKIWRGDQYRKDGIRQLCSYLDAREQEKGYLVSFSFLKDKEYTAGYLSDIKNGEVPGIEEKKI